MLSQAQGCFDFPFALTFQSKRQLTFIGFAIRRFTVGINYAIVIPSLWFYLQSFGAPYYFLGLGIAADSLVGVFVAPIVGKIFDKTRRIRLIGFVTIFLDCVGNLVYALPLHAYMPILGRCISGLGSGYVSALYGEVSRVTTPEERTRIVTILEGVRLLGITIGPSFNLFLEYFDFKIGPWTINKLTAPGFFMSILWLIVGVIHFFTVYNLTKDYVDYEKAFFENGAEDLGDLGGHEGPGGAHGDSMGISGVTKEHWEPSGPVGTYADKPKTTRGIVEPRELGEHKGHGGTYRDRTGVPGSAEGRKGHHATHKDGPEGIHGHVAYDEIRTSDDEFEEASDVGLTYFDILKSQMGENDYDKNSGKKSLWQSIKGALLRSELMVLFVIMFLMYFNQSSFETLSPLIGVELLDFTITFLSILYVAAGIELVVVIVVVWFVSHFIADRNLLLSSVAMATIGVFAQLGVALTQPHTSGCLTMAILMAFFMLLATPITSIVGKSLLSKITAPEEQGFYQGLLASSQQLGLISGPLVGSAMFNYLTYFSSATLFILLVMYGLTLSAMDKLI